MALGTASTSRCRGDELGQARTSIAVPSGSRPAACTTLQAGVRSHLPGECAHYCARELEPHARRSVAPSVARDRCVRDDVYAVESYEVRITLALSGHIVLRTVTCNLSKRGRAYVQLVQSRGVSTVSSYAQVCVVAHEWCLSAHHYSPRFRSPSLARWIVNTWSYGVSGNLRSCLHGLCATCAWMCMRACTCLLSSVPPYALHRHYS